MKFRDDWELLLQPDDKTFVLVNSDGKQAVLETPTELSWYMDLSRPEPTGDFGAKADTFRDFLPLFQTAMVKNGAQIAGLIATELEKKTGGEDARFYRRAAIKEMLGRSNLRFSPWHQKVRGKYKIVDMVGLVACYIDACFTCLKDDDAIEKKLCQTFDGLFDGMFLVAGGAIHLRLDAQGKPTKWMPFYDMYS